VLEEKDHGANRLYQNRLGEEVCAEAKEKNYTDADGEGEDTSQR